MPNKLEIGINAQKWTAKKHFENPITALTERKPFAARVTEYVDLLREAFPADEGDDTILPLEHAHVIFSDIPILTKFVRDVQLETPFTIPRTKFSLAVIARKEGDASTMGLGAMYGGIYHASLFLQEIQGRVQLGVETKEINSGAFLRAGDGIAKMCSGITGAQRRLKEADKLFKFIVSQTLEQVQDKFSYLK